jgi:hypothetical protein
MRARLPTAPRKAKLSARRNPGIAPWSCSCCAPPLLSISMKKILPLLIAATLLPPVALSAGSFEGKVTMKISGPAEAPPQMTFSLKEGFSRIDVQGAESRSAAIIFDRANEQMTILMLAQKMYMTRPLPKPVATAATPGAPAAADSAPVEKTGTTEKILGYDCVKYVSKTKDTTTEMWVTDQLGTFMGMGGGNPMAGGMGGRRGAAGPRGGGGSQAWEQALSGLNVFPLRVVTTGGGKETFRLEVTAIDKETLPASHFAPPADFQDMGAMMKGMGMPGGMGMPPSMRAPGGG